MLFARLGFARIGFASVGSSRVHFIGAAAAVVACAAASVASAQAPYFGVVTTDKAALRCDANDIAYRIGELESGHILVVHGEEEGWLRVAYPAKVSAFVNATEVDVSGNTATLTRPSRLKAANLVSGYSGSWKALTAEPLPAGTTLEVIEPAREGNGPVVGYRIKAPAQARAYIQSRSVRRATDAEVGAFRSRGNVLPTLPGADAPAATPTQPAATPPNTLNAAPDSGLREMPATDPNAPLITPSSPSTPSTSPAQPPASEPAASEPEATPPANIDLREPMNPAGDPARPPQTQPAQPEPAAPTVIDQTPRANPESGAQPAATESGGETAPRRTATLEELESAFRDVWQQPVLTAEYDELIAEYDRTIATLDPQSQQRLRQQLERRRDALKLRQEFRETVRRQEEAKAGLDAGRQRLAERMQEVEATRVYTIVGQIQPSTVYDGRRLPRMYRVVSVGGAPRTLGYLRESSRFELDRLVGQVVGVVGDAQLDPSLRLNIITPIRIDRLEAERSAPGGEAGGQ